MSNLEHLSNEELIQQYDRHHEASFDLEFLDKRRDLKKEILRRLNEPWRKQKEINHPTITKQEKMDMLKFVFEQGKRKGKEEKDDK